VNRLIHAWPDLATATATAIGLDGSRVMSAVIDTWGWRARMKLRPCLGSCRSKRDGAI
jgi:S-DNA-T family DNA segregation ATPase FtsK/SpoIIIE